MPTFGRAGVGVVVGFRVVDVVAVGCRDGAGAGVEVAVSPPIG